MGSWVVWDLETLRWAHETPGGWRNPAGFGLAVAKALDDRNQMHTFYEGDGAALAAFLATKDLVVGFNSLAFDSGVLSAYGDVSEIRRRSLDLLADLDRCSGIPHRVSLERACRATLGRGKLLADGGEAVRLWRDATPEGRRLVEEYCEQDVRLTFELWRFGAREGYILAPFHRRGRRPSRPRARIEVQWPSPTPML
jgi:DEAD/DEAH box helicase domain-containing protein